MMLALTKKQSEVMDFIRDQLHANGFPPTVREIAKHFGFSGPNGAMCHLDQLVRKGWIVRDFNRSRGIHLVAMSGGECPFCGKPT